MKKILITGASGFIGGFLVKEALNRGYETWAGVRSSCKLTRLLVERTFKTKARNREPLS